MRPLKGLHISDIEFRNMQGLYAIKHLFGYLFATAQTRKGPAKKTAVESAPAICVLPNTKKNFRLQAAAMVLIAGILSGAKTAVCASSNIQPKIRAGFYFCY